MKFFNWVHKRFNHHHPIHKDDFEFAKNVESVGVAETGDEENMVQNITGNDKDTQALLRKAVLVDALDGWKDGILAIGTFGFDPLKPFTAAAGGGAHREYLALESSEAGDLTPDFSFDSDDDDDDVSDDSDTSSESEEVNPLMLSELGHSFNDEDIAILASNNDDRDHHEGGDDDVMMIEKKSGRTTLADLFLAEAEVKMKLDYDYDYSAKAYDDEEFGDNNINAKKQNVRTKKTLAFAKKLIPKVKDETSPIKNIQRLMRRMLKRKIHPELLDLKTQKSDGQMAVGAIELIANGAADKSASESVSLLGV